MLLSYKPADNEFISGGKFYHVNFILYNFSQKECLKDIKATRQSNFEIIRNKVISSKHTVNAHLT